jgi:hypothetical protein
VVVALSSLAGSVIARQMIADLMGAGAGGRPLANDAVGADVPWHVITPVASSTHAPTTGHGDDQREERRQPNSQS